MIDITGVDLVNLAKRAYELSSPQGLGFLHFTPRSLSDQEAEELINKDDPSGPLDLDYIHGRSIKLHVRKKDGKLFLNDSWYDHTDSQYKELLRLIGVEIDLERCETFPQGRHGSACNCGDCRAKRRLNG